MTRKQEIIKTAFRLAKKNGLKSLSSSKVADATGLSRQRLHAYFKSTKVLLDAVADYAVAKGDAKVTTEALTQHHGSSQSLPPELMQKCHEYLESIGK